MKLILKTFILLFVSTYSFSAEAANAVKLPVAARLFSSGIHDIYLKQLQNFVENEVISYPVLLSSSPEEAKSELEKQVIELIQLIKKGPLSEDSEGAQEFHREMIAKLRKVIELKDQYPENNGDFTNCHRCFVNDFCLWMFTSPQLLYPMQQYMETTFSESFPQMVEDSWALQLARLNDSIGQEDYAGVQGTSPSLHNAHQNGDVPSFLYMLSAGGKEIKVVRTSNVTYDFIAEDDGESVKVAIIPEFSNYLGAMADHGKRHLYVNYIERQKESGPRESKLIENLESDPNFGSAVSVASLARNSPFYKQESPFSALDNAEDFKEAFIGELFADAGTSHYYWPRALDRSVWKEDVAAILNGVHTNYFSKSARLSVKERQQFIDVAYVKMTQSLIHILQPDVVNLSCAISIDRGPTGFTLLHADLLLQEKEQIDVTDLKRIATLAYAPGVLVRNRAVVPSHQDRFIGAVGRLQYGRLFKEVVYKTESFFAE